MSRVYDRIKDSVDARDLHFQPTLDAPQLPRSKDNRNYAMPAVWDQGQIGSCTAHATCALLQFLDAVPDHQGTTRSRLWLYYSSRAAEGTIKQDAGAMIRDVLRVCQKQGVPPETDWPYVTANFKVAPPQKSYTDAQLARLKAYHRVKQSAHDIMAALAVGQLIVAGIGVYDSFESDEVAKTGVVPMPDVAKEQCLGGHAILIVGYDSDEGTWLCRNSWGTSWGMEGYFTLPWAYLLDPNLTDDLWTGSGYNVS